LEKNLLSNGRIQVLDMGLHVKIIEIFQPLYLPKRRYTMSLLIELHYSNLGMAKSRKKGIPIFLIKGLDLTRTEVLRTNTIPHLMTSAVRLFFPDHPEGLH
jgi:hypothetical protein